MRIIAENLANADSVGRTTGAEPYRRKIPTIGSEFDRELGAQVVELGRVERDRSNFRIKHEPGHPLADANGDVRLPNVDPLIEQMDMREAQRTYEANLNMVGSARRMIARTLDILRA
ncbi:flagellar basal-body rod protein FlgC [Methylopila jiangsuensis]|uniref:Flagellar basal-body rod protein FlgC n=2 Tax=Methylopila jiangsuensis TaxID=586230 RepID=A0A9W6N3R1_9HYPH|nr:flagellar basal-body rod protein FlgC [Methylopila jiangsuensis]